MYSTLVNNKYILQNAQPVHAKRLEALQKKVFPTLSPDELLTEQHYLKHIQVFPEGQFVVLDGDKVIGMSTTMRYHMTEEDHTFLEISGNLWLTTHEPNGDWLYGLDVGVDPDYRNQGIARAIYQARQDTCRRLGLKGQITVGMPNGYLQYRDQMSIAQYCDKVISGQISDPTVSTQQKLGFQLRRPIFNYLEDPQCGNAGILMVMEVS